MKIQYKMEFDFGEDEYDWAHEIPERIAKTIIESQEVPATGDKVDMWSILEHVNITSDQAEWLINIDSPWTVVSVVHNSDLAIVTLKQIG